MLRSSAAFSKSSFSAAFCISSSTTPIISRECPSRKSRRLRDPFPVLLRIRLAQAHRHLIGGRLQLALRRRAAPKSEHAEFLAHEIQSLPQRARMRVRSEVTRAIILLEPRQPKARPLFRRIDFHQKKALVVAKRDVVTRPEFLDQLSFQSSDSASLCTVCVSKSQTASSRARVFKSACAIFDGRK